MSKRKSGSSEAKQKRVCLCRKCEREIPAKRVEFLLESGIEPAFCVPCQEQEERKQGGIRHPPYGSLPSPKVAKRRRQMAVDRLK